MSWNKTSIWSWSAPKQNPPRVQLEMIVQTHIWLTYTFLTHCVKAAMRNLKKDKMCSASYTLVFFFFFFSTSADCSAMAEVYVFFHLYKLFFADYLCPSASFNVFSQRGRDYPRELDNFEKLGSNSLPYPCDTILCQKSPRDVPSNVDIISLRF